MAKQRKNYYGTGRRKSASARVYLRQGTGQIIVNGMSLSEFFQRDSLVLALRQPLELAENFGFNPDAFNFVITTSGGGKAGQAGAVRLGISRALYHWAAERYEAMLSRDQIPAKTRSKLDRFGTGFTSHLLKPESELTEEFLAFRSALKERSFLSRDSRRVERKKYGQPGARKRFQFSKR